MSALAHLALADFRERTRRFSFVMIITLAVLLGYQVLDGFFMLRLGAYRGVYNAAWIGMLMAVTLAFFLSLIGFYVTRGNVTLDRQTGVGQILAATPLHKAAYTLGKFVSNTAVLLVIVGVLVLASVAMLLIHGEDKSLNLTHLLMPFLLFAAPVALLVAALAVLFDCIPWLQETAGNVLYFFLWLFTLPLLGGQVIGFTAIEREMTAALQAQGASYSGGIVLGTAELATLQTFVWTGFDWRAVAGPRLLVGVGALLLAAIAALPFDRFDPSRGHAPRAKQRARSRLPARLATLWPGFGRTARLARPGDGPARAAQLTPVTTATNPLGLFARVVATELKLLLKGRPLLWYVVAAGLMLASLLAELTTVQRWLLPIIWLWSLPLWSELGVRERKYGVEQLLFSAPAPLWRQLPAAWTAGMVLYVILGGGVLRRFLAEPALLPGFWAGAWFIPALALGLGAVGRSERPLQILLLSFWYLGPLNGLAAFDITGATPAALALGIPWYYLAASMPLVGLALLARWQHMRSS
ncbi:hypothetical protein [Candidatus Chloroploca asiatica]|uniref:Uncharacterized protein n=1 Tax=Candidatus Chloroploca asiatica TaxID=1506545 RepID=A0A2H3KRL4_9CHLR|nr:hypothetical protein [Candidatus Chloroploca asiatica]PDW00226.1 hypothetical protein A9Q02_10420 [Candidatus Chloroploca asiatica]